MASLPFRYTRSALNELAEAPLVAHNLLRAHAAGVRAFRESGTRGEIGLLADRLGFDLEEIKKLLLNGFKSAFLPYHEKRRFMRAISDTPRMKYRTVMPSLTSCSYASTASPTSVPLAIRITSGVASGSPAST